MDQSSEDQEQARQQPRAQAQQPRAHAQLQQAARAEAADWAGVEVAAGAEAAAKTGQQAPASEQAAPFYLRPLVRTVIRGVRTKLADKKRSGLLSSLFHDADDLNDHVLAVADTTGTVRVRVSKGWRTHWTGLGRTHFQRGVP